MIPIRIYLNIEDNTAPKIVLSGEWLANAGFKSADAAEIAIYKGTLIIRPVIYDKE
jgi:type III secretion system FlhB-like substrate exporter